MIKVRYKITINWSGQVFTFYRHATSTDQSLRYAIRQLAREVGYTSKYVRDYVMDQAYRRYEVEVK